MTDNQDIYEHLESLVVKKENIRESLIALDAIAADASRGLPGDLAHYLQRRSYEKAWAWVNEGRDIPKGTCGGKE